MHETKINEKPMPVIYTTADICKMFHIGRVKCLELFHREDFPCIKIGKSFLIAVSAFNEYVSTTRVFNETR